MNSEELKKIADIGGIGNGERDNATGLRDAEQVTAMLNATRPVSYAHPLSTTESVLQEADRLVDSHRGPEYGHPLDDFSKVVGMAKALWGRGPETPEEHSLYLILVKLARLQATPGHHDSIVDIAGYIKTYAMVIDERVKRLTL